MHVQKIPSAIEFLTIKEAAERSGWSRSYLRSLTSCGKLDNVRVGRRILVDTECLGVLMRARASRRPKPRLRLIVNNL